MDDIYIVILSLMASAIFSGTEIAFMRTNRLQLELDLKKNQFSAKIIDKFFKHQSQFIGLLLLCNNIANVIYGIAIARILEPFLIDVLPEALINDFVVLLCQTVLSTLLVLVTGEFLPKIIFGINPNKSLRIFSLPAIFLFYILYPIVAIFIFVSELVIKYILQVDISHEEYKLNTVDLNDYLKEYSNPDEDNEDVQQGIELFQNAIEFHNVKLRECMVPRTEIQAIDIEDSIEEVKSVFEDTKHSKLLVFENNIDNIIGYIHINDILGKVKSLRQKVRPIDFYPETYSAQELLKKLSKKRQSIAVVVDEFGGTSGIISIEDLIEEIFGEIEDEFDVEDAVEKTIGPDDHIFSARLEIDYLNKNYKFNFPESDDYETLAGYIIHYHESIPEIGEEILIGNHIFKIIKATDTKLEEVEIKSNQ